MVCNKKIWKGTAIPDAIVTFRDGVRTAYETRKTEINNCSDIASLKTLYDATYDSDGKFEKYNMTQYPSDPNKWAWKKKWGYIKSWMSK